ncbi:ATP synthase, Delta/Epsilon chain, beta-sandwich domain protein [Neorickettsia helminthoeca str. Oregon]|uniref:ATP synthase, Delta/Epsilon chain, beta-sandwich domain protein n=1 Tax=Neorickettsia helminthoeca str. Oregon TaxID=1286528 RepID=X5H507_9RICK|nr:ATP synthase, Delta/Epsilon chain, beta-sandwich domain protein [Neorickettsia helminthoeca str. Oregon]
MNIITPDDGSALSKVKSLSGNTVTGRFTVLAQHEDYLFSLKDGPVSILFEGGTKKQFLVEGAILRVHGGSYILTAEKIIESLPIGGEFLEECLDQRD